MSSALVLFQGCLRVTPNLSGTVGTTSGAFCLFVSGHFGSCERCQLNSVTDQTTTPSSLKRRVFASRGLIQQKVKRGKHRGVLCMYAPTLFWESLIKIWMKCRATVPIISEYPGSGCHDRWSPVAVSTNNVNNQLFFCELFVQPRLLKMTLPYN